MGSRGPAPTPTRLKVLRGERESRINRTGPRPRRRLPKLPAETGNAAKSVWRRVLREYGSTGVITAADTDGLRVVYCEAVARYEVAGRLLDASGPVIRADG